MSDLNSKAVWPGWKTVRIIGRGNFGAVYEIQRDVYGVTEKAALKVISIPQNDSEIDSLRGYGYDDETIGARYEGYLRDIVREYTLMSSLKFHPNAVYCEDVKSVQHDDGIGWDIFIKMELLTPLDRSLMKTDEIPEKQVVELGKNICSILSYCESRKLVHRDIKPENIFVSEAGIYKLGDFGIAKTVENTTGGTKTGTYRYMAPEVYNNQPYGIKADIYSFGLTLYWLLNERRLPFTPLPPELPTASQDEEARARRFGGEPIPAPVHGCDELKAIVLKACAFDPKDRYQTAAEMMADLEALDSRKFAGAVPLPLPRKRAAASKGSVSETALFEDKTAGLFGAANKEDLTAGPFSVIGGDGSHQQDANGTISLFGSQGSASAAALAEEERRKAEEAARAKEERRKAEEAARQEEERVKAEEQKIAEEIIRLEEERKKAAAAAASNKQPDDDKKKKGLIPIIIAAVLLIALLVVLLLPKNVTIPDLAGKEKSAAEEALKSLGFKNYEFKYEKSETVAKDRVIKSDPGEGTTIKAKDKVLVYLSGGDGKAAVPDVTGKPKADAEAALKDAGFKPAFEEEYSDIIENGSAVGTEPAVNTRVDEGSEIKVIISKGPAPVPSHTLSFNANGGTVSESSRKVNEGTEYGELPAPARNGYVFNGWFTDASGGSKVLGSEIMGASDVTLFAQWTKEVNPHILSFNANGGTVSEASRKVNEGSAYGTLPNPTRNGYAFNGWYTAASGGTKVSSSTKMGTKNVTIYAQWKANAYTLSFNANGGSVSETSRAVTTGDAYGSLPAPARTGYSFSGWFTSATGGSKVSESTKMGTKNVTIYAQWVINSYTVSFNANGGSVSESSRKVSYGAAYGTLPTPARDYYTFSGWYTAASGGTKVSNTTKMGTSNVTLYAHWTQNGFGPWSAWSTTAVSATDNRQVQTQQAIVSYAMESWVYTDSSSASGRGYWPSSVSGLTLRIHHSETWPKEWVDSARWVIAANTYYDSPDNNNCDGMVHNATAYVCVHGQGHDYVPFFIKGTNYETQYRYRDRIK